MAWSEWEKEMNQTTNTTGRLSRSDTVGMLFFMVAGAAIAVTSVVVAIARIVEVLPNTNVELPAEFSGTVANAPIGPNGAPVGVTLDVATIVAPSLPAASLVSLVIQQIVGALAIVIVIAALMWLSRNITVGRVFSRTNTVLVLVAGFTALAGAVLVPFFGNMAANGAFARISDRTFDNVVMSADLFPLLMLAFLAALGGTVFSIGERLQRDTEGLV